MAYKGKQNVSQNSELRPWLQAKPGENLKKALHSIKKVPKKKLGLKSTSGLHKWCLLTRQWDGQGREKVINANPGQ